jgi:hypothetical protein
MKKQKRAVNCKAYIRVQIIPDFRGGEEEIIDFFEGDIKQDKKIYKSNKVRYFELKEVK